MLGAPVIKINVAPEQLDNALDNALQMYQDFHDEGREKLFLTHTVTPTDITNKYIAIPDGIKAILRVLPIANNVLNMFDVRYQFMLNDFANFQTIELSNYTITMQHLEQLEQYFQFEKGIEFARHKKMLKIHWDWSRAVLPGQILVIETYAIIDPEVYTDIYNDIWLKKYFTALVKKQWGSNLKKFGGTQLVGGPTFNGQSIFDEAVVEIKELEKELKETYQDPADFFMG